VKDEEDVNGKTTGDDSDGIGTGAIVGIVVAVVVVFGSLIGLIVWRLRGKGKTIEDDGGGS
jgi:hypothetical protein